MCTMRVEWTLRVVWTPEGGCGHGSAWCQENEAVPRSTPAQLHPWSPTLSQSWAPAHRCSLTDQAGLPRTGVPSQTELGAFPFRRKRKEQAGTRNKQVPAQGLLGAFPPQVLQAQPRSKPQGRKRGLVRDRDGLATQRGPPHHPKAG